MEDRLIGLERATARIEVQITNADSRLTEIIRTQAETKSMLVRALHGSNGDPGLVVRVDRVEEWKKRITKLNVLLIGSVLPLVASAAWGMFRGPV